MRLNKVLEKIVGFDWDSANTLHIARHGIDIKDAEEIFFDENKAIKDDIKHSTGEKRFIIIGKNTKDKLLYQVFTIRENKIRVISSRKINKKEVFLYEKKSSRTKI
jgi:uncharacterized protein